jgi:hypothetical protein
MAADFGAGWVRTVGAEVSQKKVILLEQEFWDLELGVVDASGSGRFLAVAARGMDSAFERVGHWDVLVTSDELGEPG